MSFSATGFVVLPMKEAVVESLVHVDATVSRWRVAGAEMKVFAVQSFRSFLGTKGACTMDFTLGGQATGKLPLEAGAITYFNGGGV